MRITRHRAGSMAVRHEAYPPARRSGDPQEHGSRLALRPRRELGTIDKRFLPRILHFSIPMSLPNEQRIVAWQEAFSRVLRSDPWAVAGLLSGVGIALPVMLVGIIGPDSGHWTLARAANVLLALIAFTAVMAGRQRSSSLNERRFWGLVLLAQGAFLFAQSLALLFPTTDYRGPLGLAAWGSDLSLGLFFGLMIAAVEIRPDRRRSVDSTRLDALWAQPAAGLFVAGLLLYFPGIAHWRGSPAGVIEEQTLLLFSTLATFLTGRFLLFALEASSLRWRLQYGVLALGFVAVLVGDWLPIIGVGAWFQIPSTGAFSWLLIVAVGFNRLPFGGGSSRKAAAGVSLDLSGAHRSTTLIWTLLLPFLHIMLHRFGMLPEQNREVRELLTLGVFVVLGAYALAQRYWVELETVGLWQKHKAMAEQLQSSEQDLRVLVERHRGHRELEQSEKKFSIAFRLSPDGMLITTVQDGLILDVNDSFCTLFDVEPRDLIGRKTQDLGYWRPAEQRDAMVKDVLSRGALRDVPWNVQQDTGDQRLFAASFELIHTGHETLLLTILRDMTDRGHSRYVDFELLSPVHTAVFALDPDSELTYWSRSAEALFGPPAHAALAEPPSTLQLPAPTAPRPNQEKGKPIYRSRAVAQDGRPLRLTCHTALLEDDQSAPMGQLTFATARDSKLNRARMR